MNAGTLAAAGFTVGPDEDRSSDASAELPEEETVTRRNSFICLTISIIASLSLAGCGGGPPITGCGAVCPPPDVRGWTWVSGSNTVLQAGVYGTQGTPSPTNVPGARNFAVSWTDRNGNLWMF